jgi:hypothetical protein
MVKFLLQFGMFILNQYSIVYTKVCDLLLHEQSMMPTSSASRHHGPRHCACALPEAARQSGCRLAARAPLRTTSPPAGVRCSPRHRHQGAGPCWANERGGKSAEEGTTEECVYLDLNSYRILV